MVRYRNPAQRRTLWLGLDTGGVALPRGLGPLDHTVWTVHETGAWGLGLTRWLAIGGRHRMTWLDAASTRMRVHGDQIELSGRPTAAASGPAVARLRDRLSLGVEVHRVAEIDVGGSKFRLGGVGDVVATLGYGMEHQVGRRWDLGWQVQLRHAWVFRSAQRQVRAALRVAFRPREGHRLALEAVGFYVNRDRDQAGVPLPRNGVYGQFAVDYAWIGRRGLGVAVRGRALTSFMSGEAPVFEVRSESLHAPYAEMIVGLRAVWR